MRFDEIKNKKPEEPVVIELKGKETNSPKITANHSFLPIIQGNEYTLVATGKDYYKVKCRGQAIYVERWIFDEAPARIPRWLREQQEDFEEQQQQDNNY